MTRLCPADETTASQVREFQPAHGVWARNLAADQDLVGNLMDTDAFI